MSGSELPQLPTDGPVYVIGYARVSGKKQQTDGHSLEAQQKEIRKYCNEKGWILLGIVVEVLSLPLCLSSYGMRHRPSASMRRRKVFAGINSQSQHC